MIITIDVILINDYHYWVPIEVAGGIFMVNEIMGDHWKTSHVLFVKSYPMGLFDFMMGCECIKSYFTQCISSSMKNNPHGYIRNHCNNMD